MYIHNYYIIYKNKKKGKMGNKGRRLITIEQDLDEKLSGEENASMLIDRLLREYYNAEESNDLEFLNRKYRDLIANIKEQEIKADRIKERINEVSEQTKENQEQIQKERERVQKIKETKKFLATLIKAGHYDFSYYMKFKDNPLLTEQTIQLMEGSITIDEFLELQDKYIENKEKRNI